MDSSAATLLLVLTTIFSYPFVIIAQSPTTVSKISVVGVVYCDTCSSSTFSKQSYFLPGAEVHIQCRFRATSPKTTEQISFSVNRTTDQHGVYKLDIPSVDGINCVDGSAIVSMCQATLIGSTSSNCNVPFLKSTSSEISVKSRQENLCVYSLSGLSYKPSQKNTTLCGKNQKESLLDSSKFSYLPPYGFNWPPLPKLPFPPLPSIPTIPTLPFPPLPFQNSPPSSLPFPFPPLPFQNSPPSSLPFPFPPLPFQNSPPSSLPFPFPPLPFQNSPPSLPFPFPQIPPYLPSPSTTYYGVSPPFNLGDPSTWGTHVPSPSNASPPPPGFKLEDPTTWIPHVSSPSPPNIPQNQNP